MWPAANGTRPICNICTVACDLMCFPRSSRQAWSQIMEWEKMHTECVEPRKLVRFEGRPNDATQKAAH